MKILDSSSLSDEERKALNEQDFRFPSAEVQTLYRWLRRIFEKDGEAVFERLHVLLLPSETAVSKLTVLCARVFLERLVRLCFKGRIKKLVCEEGKKGEKGDIRPVAIDVRGKGSFNQSVVDLYREFDECLEKKENGEEVVLCSTGGYKAISAFAAAYAQLHGLPCLYTFEDSPEAYELMSMPLGYAYAALDEEINMLRALDRNPEMMQATSLPQWVRDSGKMAGALIKSYDAMRKRPFGTGQALFERLRRCGCEGTRWAEYLENLLVCKWEDLWLGDQIPETVEHSRRHSKRLMEFTVNLFRCAEEPLKNAGFDDEHPEMLALLIASIYLHDIGHTALTYAGASERGCDKDFPLGLFPSAVREVHHLLTASLLREESDCYFRPGGAPGGLLDENGEKQAFLARYVPLVAEYHRHYTKLCRADGTAQANEVVELVGETLCTDDFKQTLKPLEERLDGILRLEDFGHARTGETRDAIIRRFLRLTALMRIIDACDVQADRTISQEYMEARHRRTENEANFVGRQLEGYADALPEDLKVDVQELTQEKSDVDRMKYLCKEIYKGVFRTLGGMKKTEGWLAVQRDPQSLRRFLALSLANRYAFKREQALHFGKHRQVGFVLPVWDPGDCVRIDIYGLDGNAENGTLPEIEKEIQAEYQSVEKLLRDVLRFKAHVVGRTAS
ncbi:hypothetical protein [Pyramidobacter piscolens]|nr:hypothetical protein [Pyramidobacter piscolens]